MMLVNTDAVRIEHDASVAYVDDYDDDDDDPSLPLYQTMPYVCGKVLLASVLDSLVSAVSITSTSLKSHFLILTTDVVRCVYCVTAPPRPPQNFSCNLSRLLMP